MTSCNFFLAWGSACSSVSVPAQTPAKTWITVDTLEHLISLNNDPA